MLCGIIFSKRSFEPFMCLDFAVWCESFGCMFDFGVLGVIVKLSESLNYVETFFFYNDVIEVKEPNLWSDTSFLGFEIAHANFRLFVYKFF